MPTYADNYTFRVRASYISGMVNHKMKVRGTGSVSGISAAEAYAENLNSYVMSFENQLWDDFAWTGWEYANPNSDVWVPFVPPLAGGTIVGTIDPAGYSPVTRIKAVSHSGRAAGSKARLYWWGPVVAGESTGAAGGDAVLTPAELTGLSGATGIADAMFCAGNGTLAVFYNRLTYKVNDDLLRLVRRGIIT